MASRDYIRHFVNPNEPSNSTIGDEWLDSDNNKLYKRLVLNGTNVTWSNDWNINAASATRLQAPITLNGVSFDGSTNTVIDPLVDQDFTTNASRFIAFVDSSSAGYQRLKVDDTLSYNPSTGVLTVAGTNASTTTGTGALVVGGGIGVSGNINVGGTRNLFTGSVGIGTSTVLGTTANVLSVYGSAMVYGNVDLANPAGGTSGIYFNDGSYQTTAFTGSVAPQSFGTAGTVQYAGAGNAFAGNGDAFFWDTANSRLGIGTNSPTNVLTVRSTATPAWFNTVNSAVGSNNFEIIVGNGSSTGTTVGYVNNTTVPYGYVSTGTSTRNLVVAANGRVGVGGVTSPQVSLDVNGTAVIGASWAGNTNFINPPANGLAVQGSVGIGTYTPLATLDVRGGVGITAASNFNSGLSVASLTSNGAITGTTGAFSTSLYSATFNTAGTATVAALVSNGAVSGTTITGTNYLVTTASSTQASGTAIQRVFSKVVSATELYKLAEFTDTEGTVAIEIQVSSETSGNSGTTTYRYQGGFSALPGSYYRLMPFNDGRGHGDGPDTGFSTNAWEVYIYGNTITASGYVYGVAVSVPTGATAKTLITTITELRRGMTFTDKSADAVVTSFTNSGTVYSHKNLLVESKIGIGTSNPLSALDVRGGIGITAASNFGGVLSVSSLVSNGAVSGTTGTFSTSLYSATFNTAGTATVAALASNGAVSGTTGTFTGALYGASFNTAGTATVAALVSNGAVSGTTGTFSTSLYGAAFNTAGTATVNALVSNGAITGTTVTGTAGTFTSIQNSGNNRATEIVSNTWIHATQNLTVASSNASTTTATGAAVITGGVGIGGRLNVGGSTWFAGVVNAGGALIAQSINSNTNVVATNIQSTGAASVASLVSNGAVSGTTGTFGTSLQSGTATVASLNSNTNVVATNIQSTGQATVASLVSNGAVSGTTGTFTGALYGASFNTAGTATVNALVSNTDVKTATVNASSTIVGQNIYSNGFVQAAGTVEGNVIDSNTTITAGTGLTVTSGGVNVTGVSQFTGNVNIAGNLNVTGTISTQNANVLVVQDPIIYLGEGNTGNNWDLGLVGNYNDGVYEHTGLVRNHVTGIWTLFDTLPTEPNVNTGNIDWTNSSLTYAAFLVGNVNVAGRTDSISTTTGAIRVAGTGGVGIGGRLNVGGSAWFAGTVNAGGALIAQSINSNTNVVGVNLQSTGAASVASLVSNGAVSGTTGTFTSALYGATFNTAGTATVAALVSNGSVSGTTGTFTGALYGANFNTAGTATVAALVSNGAVSGTTGTFSTSLYGATFNTAGTATVAALVSNGSVSGTTGTFTGALYGSNFNTAGTATVAALVSNGAVSGTTGTFTSIQNSGLERAANIVSNTWIHATQNLTVASSNTSTTTGTGALVVTGGSGIGGTLNVGGSAWFAGVVNAGGALVAQSINSNTNVVGVNLQSTGAASVASLASNGAITGTTITGTAGTFTSIQNSGQIRSTEIVSNTWIHATQNLTVASSNTSTTTGTGALVVTGGVGIGGNVNVGGTRNLFTGSIGVGTSAVLGASANAFAVYGTAMVFGNIDLGNPAGGTSGIYFNDGSYQTTAFTGAATPSFGTAGTIQYAGAGNTFAGNGDNFFWDSANSRLGIGTNSPTNVLTVRSTATPAWFNTVNSAVSSNNYEIIVGNGTSTGTTVGYVNNTLVPYGYVSTGTSTRNIVVSANGRVGIGGITAPQVLLDVGGSTVIGASWAGNSNFINPPANGLAVQGSVGIGTYTPLNALDVRGGMGVTAASNFNSGLSVASLTSNGAVSGTTGVFSTSLYSATFNTAGTATVAALVSNGSVSGTTGTFTSALYGASFNTAGTATVASLVSNGTITGTTITGTTGTFTYIQNSGQDRSTEIVSNTWIHATQNLTVASSNASTTTGTGAAVITGGVGIGGRLNVGGAAWFAGVVNAGGALVAQSINSNTNVVGVNLQSTGAASVASLVSNGAVSGTTGTFTGALYGASFNTAGTATVAALVSNGAVSGTTGTFTGALYGAAFNTAGTATVASLVSNGAITGTTITGTTGTFTSIQNSGQDRSTEIVSNTWIHATQNLTVASSNASTTTGTGAAVITGGVGIGGRLNVGGSAWFAGVVNAGGALIAQSINSNTNVVGVNLQSTGQASVASLVSNGAVSGTTGVFSTSLYSATFNTAGTATVAALVSNGAVSGTTGVFSTSLYSATFNTAGTATVAALVSNGAVTGTTITGTTGTFTSIQNSGLTRVANVVSNTWIHATQNLTVASSNASTTTGTGALVITGGAGIGGNVNAGGVSHTFNGSIGIRGNTNPWGTGLSSAIQLKSPVSTGGTVSLASIDVDDNLALVRNAYYRDAIDWYHSSSGPATLYQQDATGTHTWAVAPTQNAGNVVVFTPIMTVDSVGLVASNVAAYGNMIAVGRLGVGTSSDQGFVNVAAFFGTVESYGNVKLITPTGGTAGIYFADGSYQTTAAFPGASSSGIAGAVQFSTGTGTFNSDAANLFWDDTNNRLGIGTTSPTNVLTVRSTTTPAWFNTVNSAVSSNNYEILIGNSVVHGATVGYVNNATVPYGYLSAGTTTRNIIVASNGRVGLGGATVPQNILDINGAAVIGTAYAGARTASANGLLVQGSVGIGTFTPLQPLDVRGNAYIDGTHNLFTGRVGIGTNSALGASANVLSIYGTTMVFGNIDLGNTAAGGTGVYFSDGTFQNTAYVPTTYTTFTYTGDGSTSTYSTSPVTSSSVNNTMVYINGVYQRKSTYGWSGTTVTFNAAPANFATIEIVVIQGVNAPYGSVAGDISVNGNITISGGAIVAGGSNTYVFNTVATGVYIGGNARDVQIGNAVSTTRFNSANASINTTTGAIVATGGIGIGGNVNVGGTRNLFTGSIGVGTSTPLGTTANVFSVYGTAMVYGNIDLSNPTGGISGIFFNDGTYQTTASNVEYSIKNANYTAVNGDKLLCDTSAGTFTVTLPLTPAFGTTIIIYDRANFSTTPLTIGRNSSTIEGLADDFSIDVGQTRTEFVYDGATWHLYVSIGPRGFTGTAAPTSASVAYSVALG